MTTSLSIRVYPADETVGAGVLAHRARRAGLDLLHLPAEAVRHLLGESNVEVTTVQGGFHVEAGVRIGGMDVTPLSAERDDELDRRTGEIHSQMQAAARLGLSAVSLQSGARNAAAFQCLTAGLRRLTLLAQRLGLDIRLRNGRDTALEQMIDLHRVLAEVKAGNLKIDLDAAEFHRSSVNPCEAVWAFPERIGQVRLSDAAAGQQVTLGSGEINAAAVTDALRDIGFAGPILLKLGSDHDAMNRLEADLQFVRGAGLPAG